MFKSITCAALAAVSICAMAQSDTYNGPTSKNGIYYTDADLLANPPATMKNTAYFSDVQWNVRHQANWLHGADRFDLLQIIDEAPGNVAKSLVQALYNAHHGANIARRDQVAQVLSSTNAMAMNQPATPWNAMDANNYSDVDNRPLRMVFNQKQPAEINYSTALDILDHELSQSAAASLNDWYLYTASEGEKDTIVKVLKNDAWMLTVPIYPSTITTRSF
jgi:hypothetical protein